MISDARFCWRSHIRNRISFRVRLPVKRVEKYRRIADGTVHCAGSVTYQICFRLPIPNPNPNPKP